MEKEKRSRIKKLRKELYKCKSKRDFFSPRINFLGKEEVVSINRMLKVDEYNERIREG